MFTGIIKQSGKIITRKQHKDLLTFVIELQDSNDATKVSEGDSIALNGVCFTAITPKQPNFTVTASPETFNRTTVITWQPGKKINVEHSLRLGEKLGGHLVFGHVDCTVPIQAISADRMTFRFQLPTDPAVAAMVATKGSIALDGVSLTVCACTSRWFEVTLLPYTLAATQMGELRQSDYCNLELDMLARYVANQLKFVPNRNQEQ